MKWDPILLNYAFFRIYSYTQLLVLLIMQFRQFAFLAFVRARLAGPKSSVLLRLVRTAYSSVRMSPFRQTAAADSLVRLLTLPNCETLLEERL